MNLFNAALVTPTYYVYFTSTTIITSSVLFQGFKGTPTSIVTVINGFFTICAGVVLLQLSKSAKDVPDAAVFKGDLDQIQTIAEQEQPETEPKADAIRGTAAIVRRLSSARQKMEIEELRRLHEEKEKERLEPVSEDGAPEYEWDGLRRRRTMIGSQRQRANTTPNPFHGSPATPGQPTPHPPLGWSHFPTEEELAERDRPTSPGILQSIAGTIRGRARSTVLPGHPEFSQNNKVQSPMHPVQLTEISVNPGQSREHDYGLPSSLAAQKTEYEGAGGMMSGSSDRHVRIVESRVEPQQSSNYNPVDGGSTLAAPTNQGGARRQFSFQNVFRRAQQDADGAAGSGGLAQTGRPRVLSRGYSGPQLKGATEEERLGLVKGDSHSGTAFPSYDEDEPAGDTDLYADIEARRAEKYGRGITSPATSRRGSDDEKSRSSPPRSSPPRSSPPRSRAPTGVVDADIAEYDASRRRFHERGASGGSSSRATPAPPPRPLQKDRPAPRGGGDGAAFI